MADKVVEVGAREFRESLAQYLESPDPVAVTRHGRIVGYYIPVRRKPTAADIQALHEAGQRMQSFLTEYGIDEDEVVEEFMAARKAEHKAKRDRGA